MYLQRRAMADLCDEPDPPGVLLCGEISTADLFDYVLPFGLDAAAMNKADGRRDAVGTHLRSLPILQGDGLNPCIGRFSGSPSRADSGVHTLYRCQTDEELARDASGAPLHQYPVHVQIQRPEPARSRSPAAAACSFCERRPLLQGTALAAAIRPGGVFVPDASFHRHGKERGRPSPGGQAQAQRSHHLRLSRMIRG